MAVGELEAGVEFIKSALARHRRVIFWTIAAVLLLSLCLAVKEVTVLLLLSYGIAILLDPVVSNMESKGFSRTMGVLGIYCSFFLSAAILILVCVPPVFRQYQELLINLPDYIASIISSFGWLIEFFMGVPAEQGIDQLLGHAKHYLAQLEGARIGAFFRYLFETVLSGYSVALTIVNLFLLPFLVFYIARDLKEIHRFLLSFLEVKQRRTVRTLANEIAGHIYAFFRGQLTVSVILAVLYSVGLLIVGLPFAIVVGLLSGLLNIVPYLGIGIGFVLATAIAWVTDPSFTSLLPVWAIFLAIQILEGNFLTPKIVGESVGIHPLGVMLALIVGGSLFGLLGLILAIPLAAAIRVLFQHVRDYIEKDDDVSAMQPNLP